MKIVRIAIYDPYLDTLGGGEKYMLTLASSLVTKHEVTVLWSNREILEKAQERFALNLENIQVKPNFFDPTVSFLQRLQQSKSYDAIVYLSDGSIPLVASKLFIHFQFPVEWVKKNVLTSLKFSRVSKVICNSYFTKQFIDTFFGINSVVIYPPSSGEITMKKVTKENTILSVGRYGKLSNHSTFKKQELMIEMFKTLYDQGLKNWSLILVISYRTEDAENVKALIRTAKGYPIIIKTNLQHAELQTIYAKAKIYWHAAGYGEDISKHPELAEHFGIATVQAMENGAVPIVINSGGQREIIDNGKDGFLWDTKEDCLILTKKIIDNKEEWQRISNHAKEKAKLFSVEQFKKHVLSVIQ